VENNLPLPPPQDEWADAVERDLTALRREVERLNDLLVKVAGKVNVLMQERPAKAQRGRR
jgi:hypothetical protein